MKFPSYPKYKDSGVEWLGEVPEHWEIKRFKHFLLLNDGGTWGDLGDESDTLVLRSTEQSLDGSWKIDDPAYCILSNKEKAECTLNEGDIVVTKSSGSSLHIGKSSLVDKNISQLQACFSNFMQRLRFNKKFSPFFATHILNSPTGRLQMVFNSSTTTGLANLNGTTIGKILVATPPLSEQLTIATFLDAQTAKIDTLVAKKRELIDMLKEKRAALITRTVTRGLPPDAAKAVGLDPNPRMKDSGVEWLGEVPEHWSHTRLKYACSHIVDCLHSTPKYSEDGEYPAIRTADVFPGKLCIENAKMVSHEEYVERVLRLKLEEDDIVYGREGERYGYAALIPKGVTACLAQRMMHFRVDQRFFLSKFIMLSLNSMHCYMQASQDVMGATAPHVNVETIRNYWIAEPPINEQQAITDYLDRETTKHDQMTAKVEAAIERLQEYRSALITAAVTGKIDIREAHTGGTP
jgi:type I restriction enzyme S subunit